jgi:hypothetical protein
MAMGESDNRHLSCPAESISVKMGDLPRDDKESGRTGGETRPKSSHALGKSQRGHRTRRVGKPSTGRSGDPVLRTDGSRQGGRVETARSVITWVR